MAGNNAKSTNNPPLSANSICSDGDWLHKEARLLWAAIAEHERNGVKFNKHNDNCKTMPTAAKTVYMCPDRGEQRAILK